MPDFPVLDASRLIETNEFGRTIFGTFPSIEPYVGEIDSWVSMPLRLAHSQGSGWHIEVGPYDLGRADIDRLRDAIAAYDAAVGTQGTGQ